MCSANRYLITRAKRDNLDNAVPQIPAPQSLDYDLGFWPEENLQIDGQSVTIIEVDEGGAVDFEDLVK